MFIPAAIDFSYSNPDWEVFTLAGSFTLFVGFSFYILNRTDETRLSIRDSYFLTLLSWTLFSIFGAIPFYLSNLNISLTDSVFETVSGLTTTGSTVLTGLDQFPPGLLMWRAILQGIGGVGIIILGVGILPVLGVSGMRLFYTESSDKSERSTPRMKTTIQTIILVYILLILLCATGYYFAGMSLFDAFAHAMPTLATGGYSTSDASMGKFHNLATHWVAILFMILGCMPFTLYFPILRREPSNLFRDEQVRFFLGFLAVSILLLTFWLYQTREISLWLAFNQVAFSVTSIVTTTGFTDPDYSVWGPLATVMFFIFLFVGACSGSTSGGMKMFRFQILFKLIRSRVKDLLHPNVIVAPKFNDKPISLEAREAVLTFLGFYIIFICVITLLLSALGLDFITSSSAAATCTANVGPGLGNIIGPTGNFKSLPDMAKWILCVAMVGGRLELFTVLIVFSPDFWKQ